MKITGITVIKGRPDHVYACLTSLGHIADEILVADIGMEKSLHDEVEKMKNVTIVPMGDVAYIELIRETLKNKAKYEHVLFLDAD